MVTSNIKANLFGVGINGSTRQETVKLCKDYLNKDEQCHIVTANPEILLRARGDKWFKQIINDSELVTADGSGVRWAAAFYQATKENAKSRLEILNWFIRTLALLLYRPQKMRSPIPERVTGADLIWDLAHEASEQKCKIYLLGGQGNTAERAAERLTESFPNLSVRAFKANHLATPYSTYELDSSLREFQPNIVFVGYGSPKQEEWIHQNLHRYPCVNIAVGVGGALDFIAGNAPRAPFQYQAHSLEWYWRLTHQPKRFARTLRATLLFPSMLLLSRLLKYKKERAGRTAFFAKHYSK